MQRNPNIQDDLSELDRIHFLHPTSSIQQQQQHGPAFIFTRGEGIHLYDLSGKKMIDGMSSLWNVNIGHGRQELGKVAKEQMSTLAFSSNFATFSNEPAIRLAKKLADISPGDLQSTFFTSGGSEANDTAYKLARHYWILKGQPNRKKIISRTKSYHGVAIGATSATGLKPFRDFTNSLAPDFLHVNYHSSNSLRELIEKEGPDTIAAFISEPVQGAGGVHLAPLNYFKEVKKLCEEYDILFITDEVITGFGRTGTYFGIEHDKVVPDMMCFAKGVTSGYAQLGGVMLSKKIHKVFTDMSTGTLLHGYTYSGHPMACAVALKNIEIIESECLIENTKRIGKELLDGLKLLQKNHVVIGEVRGKGLMGAIEFDHTVTASPIAPLIVNEAVKRGLICRSVVFDGQDTLVMAPPLIITKEELYHILDILDDCIHAVKETM